MADLPRWERVADTRTPLEAFIRLCNTRLERTLDLLSRLLAGSRDGGMRTLGLVRAVGAPSTTTLPQDKDACLYENLTDSKVYLAYNDAGVIKKVELT